MNTLEAIQHLGNFYVNFLTSIFTGQAIEEAHEHMTVSADDSWNPFSFILVYAEKNVFLGIIFFGN